MSNASPTQKRRPVLAISGWLLLVCLFLPTLKVCGSPMAPIEFPPTYGIYLGGVLVAMIAGSRTLRSRRAAFAALVAIYYATAASITVLSINSMSYVAAVFTAITALAGGVLVIRAIVVAKPSGRVMAAGAFIHGLVALAWTGLIAADPDAVWGAYIACAAAAVMLFAGLAAFVDERRIHAELEVASPLPVAHLL